ESIEITQPRVARNKLPWVNPPHAPYPEGVVSGLEDAPDDTGPIRSSPANKVFLHANILTVDSQFSRAEALAIKEDKIIFVGNDREAQKFIGATTQVIDAQGKTILPGLIDSHVH